VRADAEESSELIRETQSLLKAPERECAIAPNILPFGVLAEH